MRARETKHVRGCRPAVPVALPPFPGRDSLTKDDYVQVECESCGKTKKIQIDATDALRGKPGVCCGEIMAMV